MKIAVYTIAKNEAQFVHGWAQSVQDADYRLVVDTGSQDDTVQLCAHMGVTCVSMSLQPWRFDLARNIALSLIPSDVDVCISMDMDEYMEPGWRAALESAWTPHTTRLRYKYDTYYGDSVTPSLSYWADKIHMRHNYTWKRPVHETVFCAQTEQITQSAHVIMSHRPDATKHRGQYLHLLELSHEENPDCNQTLFWLAREYAHNQQPEQATQYFKKLLGREHVWHLERAEAERWLHKLLPHEKLKWIRQSVATAPERREGWLDLASCYYQAQDWHNCLAASVTGLRIQHKTHTYLDEQSAWGAQLHDLAAVSAWNLGLKQESLSHATQALALNPQDARLQTNLKLIEQALCNN